MGSSPRMRGTPDHMGRFSRRIGIIPAYAGNTSTPSVAPPPPRDHPRVCGEHLPPVIMDAKRRGSSPRMRGTPSCILSRTTNIRIIPAYAGNTVAIPWRPLPWRDHPRVCGEHYRYICTMDNSTGSSPRMRGTHTSCVFPMCSIWDHPRVCGEHPSMSIILPLTVGSSPRMRGTLQSALHVSST